ncbi:MAG: pyridoxamine 5'-phosphate oxidase family protein [Nannocystaceae bacterium]|nr:pyridoxamine 5'-phosphate oxidase family protein [bacterium]
MSPDDKDELSENTEKLWNMVDDFRVGMLVTRPHDGAPRPRPMTLAQRDDETITFVTARDATLVEELERDSGCAISMQSDRKYVALRGLAEVVDEQSAIDEVWSETMRVWFPDGPSSGRIVLVRVGVLEGEFWDVSGVQLVRFLLKAAKAYAQGSKLGKEMNNPGMHGGVAL